jgi:hypothetical protein
MSAGSTHGGDELAWLRRVPRLQEALDEDRLAELTALYGAQGVTGRLSLEDAEAAAERFSSLYHHAAPFDRRALRRLLQSCEETRSQPGRCAANLRLAERTLGPLDGRDGTPIGLAWSGPGGPAWLSDKGSPEDRS